MKFSIEREDQYTVLAIDEEKLDSSVSPQVKSELVTLQNEGVANVILDLGKVKYIDSSGLSSLLVGNRIFTETGSFVLCEVSEHAMKLITISQLDKVFDIQPTVKEAVDMVFMNALKRGLEEKGGLEG